VTGTIGSVQFGLDVNPVYRVDDVSPYSAAGDTNGAYAAWTLRRDNHSVTATPYRNSPVTEIVSSH
jgi:hypothetical protein